MKSIVIKYIITGALALLVSGVFFVNVFAQSGSVSVESKLDKSNVTVGELVKYEINIKFSPDMTVAAPPPGINLGGFEIRDYNDKDPIKLEGLIEKTVEFIIAAYDTGSFVIPPTAIVYMTQDSVQNILYTDAVGIRVESVLKGQEDDILDIKSIFGIPFDWFWIVLIGILFVMACVGGWIYYKKQQAGEGGLFAGKPEPFIPAHIKANTALDALRASTYLSEGKIKLYYIELSEVVRQYLNDRYFVPVLEKTTAETVELLEKQEIEEELISVVKKLLEESDLAKFAKHKPKSEVSNMLLDIAYDIVERTKIEEIVPDDVDAAQDREAIEGEVPKQLDAPNEIAATNGMDEYSNSFGGSESLGADVSIKEKNSEDENAEDEGEDKC